MSWEQALERIGDDPDAALQALDDAARGGDAGAALALGTLLIESGADEDGGIYWLAAASKAREPGARQLLARAVIQNRGSGRSHPREAIRLLLAAARDGEDGAIRDVVELAYALDPALLFDAALGLSAEPPLLRAAFQDAVEDVAPGWFATHGDDLLLALG